MPTLLRIHSIKSHTLSFSNGRDRSATLTPSKFAVNASYEQRVSWHSPAQRVRRQLQRHNAGGATTPRPLSRAALNWAARNTAAGTEPSIRDRGKDLGVESAVEARPPSGRARSDRQRRRACASASAAVEEDEGNERQGRGRGGEQARHEREKSVRTGTQVHLAVAIGSNFCQLPLLRFLGARVFQLHHSSNFTLRE